MFTFNPTLALASDITDLQQSWSMGEVLVELFLIAVIGLIAYFAAQAFNRFMGRIRSGRGPWRNPLLRVAPVLRFGVLLLFAAAIGTVVFNFSSVVLLLVFVAAALAFGIGSVDILRNLLAGLTLGLQRSFKVGDRVRVDDLEGEVVHLGELNTVLRSADGARVEIPNHQFITGIVINSALQDIGAPVEVVLPLPPAIDLSAAKRVGFRAAAVSKYASTRRRPDVMIEHDNEGQLTMMVRVFVFEARYEGHLRSEITELVQEGLQLGQQKPDAAE